MRRFREFCNATQSLLRETVQNYRKDNVSRLAASFAFYSSFSLAPALVIGLAVAGAILGQLVVLSRLTEEMKNYVGPEAALFITETVNAWRGRMTGSSATVIGVVVSLFGATAAFVELQSAFNIIWRAGPNKRSFMKQALYERAVAFVVVVGIGVFLLISLILGATVEVLNRFMADRLPLPASLFQLVNLVVTFVLTTLSAAALFRLLPDRRPRWRDVWVGAVATSALWALGKYIIAMYFAHTAVSSLYGAAGSFAIILLWIYYNAQVLFFGAEVAHAHEKVFGPDNTAISGDEIPSASCRDTLQDSTSSRGNGQEEIGA